MELFTRWSDDLKKVVSNWIAAARDRNNWKYLLEGAYVQH